MQNTRRGNLIIGQSGGPTAVINASLVGAIEEALRQPAVGDVIGAIHGVQGILDGDLVDLRQENAATLATIRRTPSAALGSGRYRLRPDDPERFVAALRDLDVRYFLYIGGNDSADTTHRIAQAAEAVGYPLRAIAIPKTVDNDLPLTDHCPGYGSIARFLALSTRDTGRDTEAMHLTDPIKLIEVPGRNAGWVAASSALGREHEADAPHLIFPPEYPLAVDRFLDAIQATYDRLGFVVAVVAETIQDENGRPLGILGPELDDSDAFGHRRLSGAAGFLSEQIARRLGLKARWEKPGNLSRMSMVCASETDIDEAYRVGQRAVQSAVDGETDRMITLVRESDDPYRCETSLAPLDEIANHVRALPPEFLTEDRMGVTPEFVDYARPLLGGPLPEYARLRRVAYPAPVRTRTRE
jgi:ATP-dependent phosphofructokinase / diphosphate-dependent phosphofructokinase